MQTALIVFLVILAIPLILLAIGSLLFGGTYLSVMRAKGYLLDHIRSYPHPTERDFPERFQQLYRQLPGVCRTVVVCDLAEFSTSELAFFLEGEFRRVPDRNFRLAVSSTLALWGISTDETRNFLESAAYTEDPDELGDGTAKALGALLKLGDERALEELKELRGDYSFDQRFVYEPLVDAGDEESIRTLEERLPAAGEKVSWELPPLVLGRDGRRKALPALLDLIDSGDDALKAATARVLWRFPDEATVDLLKSLRRDRDGTVRRRACQSLAHIADNPVRRGDLLIESWAAKGNLRLYRCWRNPFTG